MNHLIEVCKRFSIRRYLFDRAGIADAISFMFATLLYTIFFFTALQYYITSTSMSDLQYEAHLSAIARADGASTALCNNTSSVFHNVTCSTTTVSLSQSGFGSTTVTMLDVQATVDGVLTPVHLSVEAPIPTAQIGGL